LRIFRALKISKNDFLSTKSKERLKSPFLIFLNQIFSSSKFWKLFTNCPKKLEAPQKTSENLNHSEIQDI